jgi:hypothetical protein
MFPQPFLLHHGFGSKSIVAVASYSHLLRLLLAPDDTDDVFLTATRIFPMRAAACVLCQSAKSTEHSYITVPVELPTSHTPYFTYREILRHIPV